jgi:hypothetical protein
MYIKFKAPDPRAGQTVNVDEGRAKQYIDAHLAEEVKEPRREMTEDGTGSDEQGRTVAAPAPAVTRAEVPNEFQPGRMPTADEVGRRAGGESGTRKGSSGQRGTPGSASGEAAGGSGTSGGDDGSPTVSARRTGGGKAGTGSDPDRDPNKT